MNISNHQGNVGTTANGRGGIDDIVEKIRSVASIPSGGVNVEEIRASRWPSIVASENASIAIVEIEKLAKEMIVALCHAQSGENSITEEMIEKILVNRMVEGIDSLNPLYTKCLHVLNALCCLQARLTANYVRECADKVEMDPITRSEYLWSEGILSASNDLFVAWNQDCGRVLTTEQRKERGLIHPFATIDDQEQEVLWCDAYEDEVDLLVYRYRQLVEVLKQIEGAEFRDARNAKIAYYEALARAYETCDPEDWKKANLLLPGQTGAHPDVGVHVHSIEAGYWKDAIQTIPETSFRMPNENDADLNALLVKNRRWTTRYYTELAHEIGISDPSEIVDVLDNRTNYRSYTFVGGAMELVFKPVGQILPNRLQERLEGGLCISTSLQNMQARLTKFGDSFYAVFGDDHRYAEFFKEENYDAQFAIGWLIGSHEYGHALGFNETTIERIDPALIHGYVEEWKATVGGMILTEWIPVIQGQLQDEIPETGQPTWGYSYLRTSILHHIANATRYTATRSENSSHPYLRKSIMIVRVMEAAGVLYFNDGKLDINLSEEKVCAFYRGLRAQYEEVLKIYDSGDSDDFREWFTKNLVPSDAMREIFRHFDVDDKSRLSTIEDFCEIRL